MEIRRIKADTVTQCVKSFYGLQLLHRGGYNFCFKKSMEEEKSPVGREVLAQLLENNKIAAAEQIPLCQDTGMAVLFVEYGDKVVIEDGSFEDAVMQGVRQAYDEGYLRKSVVSDPVFDRKTLATIRLPSYTLELSAEIR